MEVSALLAEYRRRADDRVEPYFTSDEEAIRFAAEAEREAAIRSNLLFDTVTAGVAVYELVSGAAMLDLSPLVYRIDAGNYQPGAGGRPRQVCITGLDWIREQCDWTTRSASYVEALAHLERNEARLYPIPNGGGTLRLDVYRLPLNPLEDTSDEPGISEEHHDGLVDWMLYRTWIAKDAEVEDPQRAAQALADFTERFGERPMARVMRKHRERRRVTTRMAF